MKPPVCSETVGLRLLDNPDNAVLRQIRELYIAAGWIDSDDPADFLLPAIKGSTVAIGAFDGEQLIGFGRALSDGCSDAYIQDVVVAAECRGQGIGGRIIRKLRDELAARGVDWIALVGEPGTEKFYAKLGLQPKSGYTMWMLDAAK